MLSRRHLRIKVMQSIFAYSQSGNNVPLGEKSLISSLNGIFDLYIYQMALLGYLARTAARRIEEGKEKKLPTPEDLNPNLRFIENPILTAIVDSKDLDREEERCKPNWIDEDSFAKKTLIAFRETEEFQAYMAKESVGMKDHKEIILFLLDKFLLNSEHLESLYEGKNLSWITDLEAVAQMLGNTVESITVNKPILKLVPLYRDKKDDLQFSVDLFRKTIVHNNDLSELVDSATKNWDADRIASTDMILMKMALAEFEHIASVPTKVTMNEYIEISKEYSTPKSAVFINGVLDKVLADMKKSGRINKSGKGLIDM
ncbi:MAG: N utilization substance protein B [Bacteroidia bacterium]|jgi:N utilization substance protein B